MTALVPYYGANCSILYTTTFYITHKLILIFAWPDLAEAPGVAVYGDPDCAPDQGLPRPRPRPGPRLGVGLAVGARVVAHPRKPPQQRSQHDSSASRVVTIHQHFSVHILPHSK